MKVSYKWLQSYFEKPLPTPEKLVELLSFHSFEIEDLEKVGEDFMIDVDVLPNRAHDALSHKGIAGDISAILEQKTKDDRYSRNEGVQESEVKVEVKIEAKDKCRVYSVRVIENIIVGPSPEWLRQRLEAIGQKSINNVVDATNFVMFDIGQPIHAFDLDKIDGGITIRDAVEGEQITTLMDEEKTLKDFHMVISDDSGVLAIAGVKGGKKAEVTEQTQNILIECANFEPLTVRKTARRLNLLTDSSKRFENEISPVLVEEAMERITDIILEVASTDSTKLGVVESEVNFKKESHEIHISVEDCNNILGTTLSSGDVANILDKLSFNYLQNGDSLEIKIPKLRLDLRIKEDMIEEIGRIYGYKNIQSILPAFEDSPKVSKEFYYQNQIQNFLTGRGYSEVYTYSFVSKGEVKIKNPIASDKKYLRTDLTSGVSEAVLFNKKNKDYLGMDEIKVFEFGRVFKYDKEWTSLAVSNFDEKMREELEDDLKVHVGGVVDKDVFETNFTELLESLVLPGEYDQLTQSSKQIFFKEISPYPTIVRDIAVWVTSTEDKEKVELILAQNAGEFLVKKPRLVDTFQKDERVSLAYRLVFQSKKGTLTDAELEPITDKIYKILGREVGFEIR